MKWTMEPAEATSTRLEVDWFTKLRGSSEGSSSSIEVIPRIFT